MKKENWISRLEMKSWFFIIGIFLLWGMNQINFDPTDFLRIVLPILLFSSFGLLGIFALTEVRKTVKEHYSRKTKNIQRDMEGMRQRQKHEELEEQIKTDQEILSLRESLRGFKRNYFENCVIYSAILFTIALLLTFIDLGLYIQVPNSILIALFFLSGLFYFSKMIQSIFFALNIIKLDN